MTRDRTLILAALVLFALPLVFWLGSSSGTRERREAALAGVPEFPAKGQPPVRRRPPPPRAPAPPALLPASASALEPKGDRLNAFLLAPAPSAAVISVNALLNTPLFERIKACIPQEFAQLQESAKALGLDAERDIDRIALVPGGAAVSGFFEGKQVGAAMLPGAERRDYRGQTQLIGAGRCVVQMGNLLLLGPATGCDDLVDRALSPPPSQEAAGEVYGDLFMRADLTQLRSTASTEPDALRSLLDSLDGVTVRANVWDSVALSLEGAPHGRQDARELAQLARGAISLVESQLGDDEVELRALADLAQVSARGDKLEMNLAVPAKDLLERLHLPCPGQVAERDR